MSRYEELRQKKKNLQIQCRKMEANKSELLEKIMDNERIKKEFEAQMDELSFSFGTKRKDKKTRKWCLEGIEACDYIISECNAELEDLYERIAEEKERINEIERELRKPDVGWKDVWNAEASPDEEQAKQKEVEPDKENGILQEEAVSYIMDNFVFSDGI